MEVEPFLRAHFIRQNLILFFQSIVTLKLPFIIHSFIFLWENKVDWLF